jgi:lipoprotein-releasing system ATP-binding protein
MISSAVRLTVQDLCKNFQSAAETLMILDQVSFTMELGENLSIVGPSGCGKSTLLYILGTLDKPSSGTVELAGVNPFLLSAQQLANYRNTKIGFIFQDHHLLPQLTVAENILLPAMAKGAAGKDTIDRADELIEAVGLGQRRNHRPGQLSGGERQRTAVARALLHYPSLILADEPTGNLDADNGHIIADLLYDLPARQGAMLIVVTHSPELAQRAGRRMKLHQKRLIEY